MAFNALKIKRLKLISTVIDLNAFLYDSRTIHLSSYRKEWPMNIGKTIFAQIIDFLPMPEKLRRVHYYDAETDNDLVFFCQ
jgi:hypothetical protein